ncbi:unnamed protein product [Leptidea sinapis]|uniref:Amino acid transporter transmembrane domain-containing protein n=1 Tax=Leptidea sinapis TaxID=189913 RepID=A0A5E4PPG1_9NEOP|nr:unnamed protein product [Leptidea sinapis]
MGQNEKKGTIYMDNFNSTANLASNPGFQSTLSLGSKEVINEKAYVPFQHRKNLFNGLKEVNKTFIDWALTCTYLAALCVYIVFIAENFKEVLDEYVPSYKLSVEAYCALTLVPLVLICQIRNLKWLVPFSAIANVLLVICFSITMYYIFTDLPSPKEREMVAEQFLGCPGVLNVAMTIVIALYGIVGFFGYMKFGDDVRGSLAVLRPNGDDLETVASQDRSPLSQHHSDHNQNVALAAAFPDLELFINLCGAIFLSSLGLLTPVIVDTVHKWDRGLGFCNWILIKNIFIALISLIALFAGSYTSVKGMLSKYQAPLNIANLTSTNFNDTLV